MDTTLLVILIVVAVVVVGLVGVWYTTSRRRLPQAPTEPEVVDRTDTGGGVEVLERPVEVAPVEVVPEAPPEIAEPEPVVEPSFFERLGKARSAFTGYLAGLVGLSKVGEDEWEELEEALIRADVGVKTSMSLIEDVRTMAKEAGAEDGVAVLGLLKQRMHEELKGKDRSLRLDDDATNVWLFVGVNGVGKTTTIGKIGRRLVDEGHKPLMAAGDTFRAAAAEQLTMWAERAGTEIVRGNEGGDPSSVIFDGVQAAAARGRERRAGRYRRSAPQ